MYGAIFETRAYIARTSPTIHAELDLGPDPAGAEPTTPSPTQHLLHQNGASCYTAAAGADPPCRQAFPAAPVGETTASRNR